MTGNIDIESIDRKARTAGYEDGLLELFASMVLLVLALGWLTAPGIVGIPAALVAVFGWRVVERVKERVTYPRIGFHRERPDDAKETARGMLLFIGGAFVLMAAVVFLSGGLGDVSEWRRAAPLLSGVTLAAGFWYSAEKSGLLRLRLVAAWSVLSGVLLWWFGSGETYSGVAWHLVGLALPLAAIGGWVLLRFLRAHPIPPAAGG